MCIAPRPSPKWVVDLSTNRPSPVGNRHTLPLTGAHPWRGPLAPRTLLRFLATMGLSDSRLGPSAVIDSRRRLRRCASPSRVSQVPRSFCLRALPPTTPESPAGSSARSSPAGGGLHHSLAGWPTFNSVTRPNRVHSRCGSRICEHGASTLRLLRSCRPHRYLLNEQLAGSPPFRRQE